MFGGETKLPTWAYFLTANGVGTDYTGARENAQNTHYLNFTGKNFMEILLTRRVASLRHVD